MPMPRDFLLDPAVHKGVQLRGRHVLPVANLPFAEEAAVEVHYREFSVTRLHAAEAGVLDYAVEGFKPVF